MLSRRLQSFVWVTLAVNVAVILWGAGVRATGSGAGCGSHWPLCNGEVVPRAPTVQTVIEFTHRATSGLALVLVVVLVAWVFRAAPPRHPARAGAIWSFVFILGEAMVGAAIVLFDLVVNDRSLARALVMPIHLLNTFLLLGALALTALWCAGHPRVHWRAGGPLRLGLAASALGMMLAGASGAIAALGDTLFPSTSLSSALARDLSSAAHLLLRLRLVHPFVAVAVAATLLVTCYRIVQLPDPAAARRASWTAGLVALQVVVGMANVGLLAPAWMQILHLFVADLVWISLVLLAATVLADDRGEVASAA